MPDPNYYTSLAPFAEVFRQGRPVLTYHVIGPRPPGARLKGLYLSPRLFNRQLAELRVAGYAANSLDSITDPSTAGTSQVWITMDDATRKTAQHALPILQRHGFQAIQFVVAGRIGETNDWQTARGEIEEPLMDTREIQDWLEAGQEIGAHTLTHPWLTRIPRSSAREEITACKKSLEDRFARPIDHFCYPYGDFNEAVMELVAEAGYRTACTTRYGVNTADTPLLALNRITARYRSRSLRSLWAWFTGRR